MFDDTFKKVKEFKNIFNKFLEEKWPNVSGCGETRQ